MKTLKLTLLIVGAIFTINSSAQNKKVTEAEIWVGGVCEMCEKRIENAVDISGVIRADYNLDTHILSIVYKNAKISENMIHASLNGAGHDTGKSTATDEQYSLVHECCQYRSHDHEHHGHDHEDGEGHENEHEDNHKEDDHDSHESHDHQ